MRMPKTSLTNGALQPPLIYFIKNFVHICFCLNHNWDGKWRKSRGDKHNRRRGRNTGNTLCESTSTHREGEQKIRDTKYEKKKTKTKKIEQWKPLWETICVFAAWQ